MKISLAWLNELLNRPTTPDEAEAVLTAAGFPVEEQEHVTLASGNSDTVLDVEVTSNRGDCLSHLGVARELAASSGRTLRAPAQPEPRATGDPPADRLAEVENRERTLCPLYTARVLTGVKVGPSPAWLVDRLEALGMRSVNNVVDVTNLVLHETGQPLHAFDLNKLAGRCIVVRRAAAGEPFVAIDGSRHELPESVLVIADAQRPVAVAGIMGGLDSEVGEATTAVLLESARFDPLSVRRAGRRLKLASDSSYRFERGVDPLGVDRASRRAAALILGLAGGELAPGVLRRGQPDPEPGVVAMRPERCRALLGLDLSDTEQVELLGRLGLEPSSEDGRITCRVPTFRLDLHREVDLIEEIARLHGLNDVPTQPKIHIVTRPTQPHVAAREALDAVLVAHGYHEAITFSFLGPKAGKPFVPAGAEPLSTDDERRKTDPMLRPSLLPSLLHCRKANQDLGNTEVRLFELASAWCRQGGEPVETRRLALLGDAPASGGQAGDAVRGLRGVIEEAVETLGGAAAAGRLAVEPVEDPVYDAAAELRLGDAVLGRFGLLSASLQAAFDLQRPVVVGEFDAQALVALYPPARGAAELPRFPGIERDLSVVVDEAVRWADIEQAVRGTEPALLESLRFVGAYRGKPIEKGKKSVSLRMMFRDPRGTLRHEQVDPQVDSVVRALGDRTGAVLRA